MAKRKRSKRLKTHIQKSNDWGTVSLFDFIKTVFIALPLSLWLFYNLGKYGNPAFTALFWVTLFMSPFGLYTYYQRAKNSHWYKRFQKKRTTPDKLGDVN